MIDGGEERIILRTPVGFDPHRRSVMLGIAHHFATSFIDRPSGRHVAYRRDGWTAVVHWTDARAISVRTFVDALDG